MHPLLHLIATRPELLAEHAEAYAALVAAEVPRITAAWQRRTLLQALAWCGVVAAVGLAGVAAMLWAVTAPDAALRAPWALLAVPLLPLIASLAFGVAAKAGDPGDAVAKLRDQIAADLQMLREAAAA